MPNGKKTNISITGELHLSPEAEKTLPLPPANARPTLPHFRASRCRTVCRRKAPLNGEAGCRLLSRHGLLSSPPWTRRTSCQTTSPRQIPRAYSMHRAGQDFGSRLRLQRAHASRCAVDTRSMSTETTQTAPASGNHDEHRDRVKKQQKQTKIHKKFRVAAHKIVNHADSHVL